MHFRLVVLLLVASCVEKGSDRFVTINGNDQHILDLGKGKPVVVFVAGFGNDLKTYDRVQQALSTQTRTISYDRAGLGKSALTVPDRSLETLVNELNAILEQENISSPYILVGHSSGGHIVRYFAHAYPAKVAGMVLIDPSVEY